MFLFRRTWDDICYDFYNHSFVYNTHQICQNRCIITQLTHMSIYSRLYSCIYSLEQQGGAKHNARIVSRTNIQIFMSLNSPPNCEHGEKGVNQGRQSDIDVYIQFLRRNVIRSFAFSSNGRRVSPCLLIAHWSKGAS